MSRAQGRQNGSPSLVSIPGPWRGQAQTGRAVALAAVLMGAAVAGALVAISPIVVLVVCVATVAAVATTSAGARFVIVVAGGLFVIGTSDQLDAPKSAYLAWVALSSVLAIARLVKDREQRRAADNPPLLIVAVALAGAIALSLLVALSAGTPLIDSLRDAAPYGLLAVAPLLAWDGARSRMGPHMEAITVAAGLIATTGFAIVFLGRRGIADLPLASFGSASAMLSALVLVVAMAALLSRRSRRLLWAILAAIVVALLFATGTRSVLALLVGPAVMVLAGANRVTRFARLAGAALVIGGLALTFLLLAGQSSIIDVVRLTDRLGLLVSLGSDFSADQSLMERLTQVGVASSTFAQSPIVGVGLGYRFEWTRFGGESFPSYTIDTSLSLAAKFGLIGVGLFGIATLAMSSFYRRVRHRLPEHVRLSFVGFAAVSMAMLPLGNPLEDKGFGLAVCLLVAWALASASNAQADPNIPTGKLSSGPGSALSRAMSWPEPRT